MLKEELKNIKESKKDLRKFGLTVGTVLLLVAVTLFLLYKSSYVYFAVIGGFLILFGIFFPKILKPLNKSWMTLALILGWFMSRVILIILFYFVLTPIGFVAKIFGKKFLNLKINNEAITYWEKREEQHSSKIEYERQF